MTDHADWKEFIERSYINYLKTSFYFKDKGLRASFQEALSQEGALLKGPFDETAHNFKRGVFANNLAERFFPGSADGVTPALLDSALYAHQETAVKSVFGDAKNIVVATGTASGKTECFLYPILFDLYRQHLNGALHDPGVRALVIYPMNALANDQRNRLGEICARLADSASDFEFTFGQYTGQTPENINDRFRNGRFKDERRLPGELVFREEMRATPPHILLTNYSMLEYLLIRPQDSPLFERGTHWRFIVLDEAHLHRGARGAEMGMLMRRLKQRVSVGGRSRPFSCIATSATITSVQSQAARAEVAAFASALFGEPFSDDCVIFGETQPQSNGSAPRRRHLFARALESAFLVHENGKDRVALNRTALETDAAPIETALCRDCGQHYYIGQEIGGKLLEPIRDPSVPRFGVTYFMPVERDEKPSHILCRRCAAIRRVESRGARLNCDCGAEIFVKKCAADRNNPDQIAACELCNYTRGSYKDPVQEIVHGSDGPNAVFVTALHQLLPDDRKKVLSFADNRQEAAFFAWYAESSYNDISDRNSILRALTEQPIDVDGLSVSDLADRLRAYWEAHPSKFREADTAAAKKTQALKAVWREALTEDKRISLMGVGLAKWFVHIPRDFEPPKRMLSRPWAFSRAEAIDAVAYLLRIMAERRAVETPNFPGLIWSDIAENRPQLAYSVGNAKRTRILREWGSVNSAAAQFLARVRGVSVDDARTLMQEIWQALMQRDKGKRKEDKVLQRVRNGSAFRLNPTLIRVSLPRASDIWECAICGGVSVINIRGRCSRWRCSGRLRQADKNALMQNHYRILYESGGLPLTFYTEEHTAQIDTDEAEDRQDAFKNGQINLLSSSTTFEVGVDLGDLDVVFLRNVPPEPFNYTQRVGRAGRRDTAGFALTYCRRNSHDLHYYEDPKERAVKGEARPPLVHIENPKIILRHITAAALAAFFKKPGNAERFHSVSKFIGDLSADELAAEFRAFCQAETPLHRALKAIVPKGAQRAVGLRDGSWIDKIAGEGSRLHDGVSGLVNDIRDLKRYETEFAQARDYSAARRVQGRLKALLDERTLEFLSRKAILPKYGFPVDTVELETLGGSQSNYGISLQRDMSQAIAEYAPGNKIVANKKVWESSGIRLIPGKTPPIKHYRYDDSGMFEQWNEKPQDASGGRIGKYLTPAWGFLTELGYRPIEPQRRTERLYTTRPFFGGFEGDNEPEPVSMGGGVTVTAAAPGSLFILSEGRSRAGFHVCLACGRHSEKREPTHKTLYNSDCAARMDRYSYGYELATDVVKLSFPMLTGYYDAHSLGYALLLGAAEATGAPETDLNVAVSRAAGSSESSIILYDNVPGGAGLVEQLSMPGVFDRTLRNAKRRVQGGCRCDSSCYGCLRSYRNQFVHPQLDRKTALAFLNAALGNR